MGSTGLLARAQHVSVPVLGVVTVWLAGAPFCLGQPPSVDDVSLENETVVDTRTISSCGSISVGPEVVAASGSALHLEAGGGIVIKNDVRIESGASLTARSLLLLRDDFDGTTLAPDRWFMPEGPGTFFGRTQLRPASQALEVQHGAIQLRLDTHNPTALVCGDSFWGSEIVTHQVFDRGNGLVFEARSRFRPQGEPSGNPLPGGLVGSLFSYGLVTPSVRDEIDFELLSNDVLASRERVLTNVFNDDDFSSGGHAVFVSLPGLDLTDFNVFEIAWLPDRVRFLVNGTLVREETHDVPDAPMSIRLNLWAPDGTFAPAYDPALQPDCDPADNRAFFYEVDYVEVRRCPESR